eukprot:796419_1
MSWQCLLSLSIHLTLSIDSDCNGGACAPLTTVEKQAILDLHNELRDRVAGGGLSSDGHPSATDMNYLIWDEGLEKMAQTYVESCPGLNHNPDPYFLIKNQRDANPQNTKWGTRNGPLSDSRWCGAPSWNSNVDEDCIYIGENLLVTDPRYDLDGILEHIETGWWDEYIVWSYGNHDEGCTNGEQCGHYTQMVWSNTRYIGCGYANGCTSGWPGIFICNYFPAGNFNSVPPYTSAEGSNGGTCSECMSDRTECKSMYVSRSITANNYPQQPYNALCGGGACPYMCDGDSSDRESCNHCTPDQNNIDCNDGTIALDDGRNICNWSQPPSSQTATPTIGTPTVQTTAPTPAPTHACGVMMSNFDRSSGRYNGEWKQTGASNGKTYYTKYVSSKDTTYYMDWMDYGRWVMHDTLAENSFFGYCEKDDLMTCTAGDWYAYSGGWQLDSDAAISACAPSEPTTTTTGIPTTPSPAECVTIANFDVQSFNGEWEPQSTYNGEKAYKKDEYWLFYSEDGVYYWAIYTSLEDGSDNGNVWDLGWCEQSNIENCDGQWERYSPGVT